LAYHILNPAKSHQERPPLESDRISNNFGGGEVNMADTTTPGTSTPVAGKAARAAVILSWLGFAVGAVCIVAGIASGLGARMGLWHFRTGFLVLQVATFSAFGVIAVSLIGAIMAQRLDLRRVRTTGLLGLVLGVVAAAPPLYEYYLAKSNPVIHDVSTDTAYPPEFLAILPLRSKDDNSLQPNAEVAAMQAAAFPDLQPAMVATTPDQTLRRAESAARAMGWEIVAVDPQAMRIEATATSLLFGFKDDIVIRIRPEAEGKSSRVDMRSASRVGKSDLGVNARRIRAYFKAFDSAG
jgi:uncharacterized protein (DUF1499 family)